MSLDFYLETPRCDACGRLGDTLFTRNITHNVNVMWMEAGCYEALYGRDGSKKAGEIIVVLQRALADMEARPAVYEAMNPENGWGSYDGALDYLRDVLAHCILRPDALIKVCR